MGVFHDGRRQEMMVAGWVSVITTGVIYYDRCEGSRRLLGEAALILNPLLSIFSVFTLCPPQNFHLNILILISLPSSST